MASYHPTGVHAKHKYVCVKIRSLDIGKVVVVVIVVFLCFLPYGQCRGQ